VDRLSGSKPNGDRATRDQAEVSAAALRRASEEDAHAAPGGGAALDTSQVNAPAQVRGGNALRRQRWKRRHKSAEFLRPLSSAVPTDAGEVLRPVRPARCSWTLGQTVGVMHDGSRPAGYAGLERCSSIWSCPHCSATIRAGRAAEIEQAVTAHQATGGSVVFFTGTVRHHAGDQLEDTLGQVLDSWSRLRRNKGWRLMKKKYAIAHYIRAIEVTGNFSDAGHGWHPHCHALLFLDGDISEENLGQLKADLFGYWSAAVEALGGKRPTEKGLDLQKCDRDGKVLARYVGKIQEKKKWTAGAEMARFDAKSGRGESISPFELLDEDSSIPAGRKAFLWREYYSATKGRRAITWSRGLKKLYEIGEKTDEEIQDEAASTTLVWRTSARVFRAVRRENVENLAVALELAEAEDWDKLNDILPGRRAKARSAPPSNRV
jgi:hypothetical protein